jgi:hypothetical protein
MPGLYFLIKALDKKSINDYGLSVFFFSMAAWTRVTWFPCTIVLLFFVPFLMRFWRSNHASRAPLNRGRLLLLSAMLLMATMLLINYLRFNSPFDFGVKYQNPGSYLYLRNLKLLFPPETRFWNTLFNVSSYYLPLGLIEHFGLVQKSYSYVENFMPSLFAYNPQFIVILLFIPFGLYKSFKNREPLRTPLSVLLMTTIYLNLIIGYFGTMVIMRYFVEFYLLLMLTFFTSLMVFMRLTYPVVLLSLMLMFYMPAAAKAFLSIRPTTHPYQTLSVNAGTAITAAETKSRPEPNIKWPIGTITARNLLEIPGFSVIGLEKANQSYLMGRDIFAVYMIPEVNTKTATPRLTIKGLTVRDKGTVHVFFEDVLIGAFQLSPGRAVDYSGGVSYPNINSGPYQILVVFTPGDSPYLPPRSSGTFELALESIQLEKSSSSPNY